MESQTGECLSCGAEMEVDVLECPECGSTSGVVLERGTALFKEEGE